MTDEHALGEAVFGLGRAFGNTLDRLRAVETREPPAVLAELAANGGFDLWDFGTGPFTADNTEFAPGWLLILGGSSTASISRDSANADVGSVYDAAILYTHAAGGYIRIQQQPLSASFAGRSIALSARVKAGCPVRAYITDGVTFYYSEYSVLDGLAYETLTVVVSVPYPDTSTYFCGLEISTESGTVYVDNVSITENTGAVELAVMPASLDRLLAGYLPVREVPSIATPTPNRGYYYTKDLAGISTPYFVGDDGVEHNLLTPSVAPTGYVPYVGATADLVLGAHDLYVRNIFGTDAASMTMQAASGAAGALLQLQGGDATATNGAGGMVFVQGGVNTAGVPGDADGGDIRFQAGIPFGAGDPGIILFSGANNNAGLGGDVQIEAGYGTGDNGGNIYMLAGPSTGGTQGGNVLLVAGSGTGGATNGLIQFNSQSGGSAGMDTTALLADRTFVWPDQSGTVALLSDIPGVTGFVPYTGATADLNLGAFDLLFTDNVADIGASGGSSPRSLYAATSVLIGRASVASGSVYLRGLTSGQVRIRSADAAGTWDWTVPTDNGSANEALVTDGAGVTSWSQISLTAGVTGTLPIANGGTAATSAGAARTNLGIGTGDSPTFTGLTLSGLTAGSVVFAGVGGLLSQDNANFIWDNTNKYLGIGITPIVPFHVFSTLTAAIIQRDTSSTTVTSAVSTLGLVNNDTTINNSVQLTFSSLDSAATLRTASTIKGIFTARTAGTITGVLSFHTNNGTAATQTQIATMDATGLNLLVGRFSAVGLTASRLVATDASKNLVNTVTLANVVSSISDVTGSSGTGNLILSASPTFTGTLTAAAITASGTHTLTGAFTQTGAVTFSTGTGAVSLNGATTVNATLATTAYTTVVSTNQIDEATLSFASTEMHLSLRQSGGTAGLNKIGATLVLSKINSSRPGGAISSVQTSADADQMGLAFYTHSGAGTTDTLIEAMRIDHDGTVKIAGAGVYGLQINAGSNRMDGALMVGAHTGIVPIGQISASAITGSIITLARHDVTISADDMIGRIDWRANDTQTTTNFTVANIEAQAISAIATDINPGRLIFRTTPSTVAAVPLERFRLDELGSAIFSYRVQSKQGADVASTGNLVLGTDGNVFEITGTTQVDLISNLSWQNGSVVILLFTGIVTVKNGTASSGTNIRILLAGAVDFVSAANNRLTLVLAEIGGTQCWREVTRSL